MKNVLLLLGLSVLVLPAQELRLESSSNGLRLAWERSFPAPTGVESEIHTKVMSSTDLMNWVEETTVTAEEVMGDGVSEHVVTPEQGARFFQIEESTHYKHRSSTAAQPASYDLQLKHSLTEKARISVEAFRQLGSSQGMVSELDWDPRTATFFTEYNTSPEDHNTNLPADDPERRLTDFRLNEEELALFTKNGFVVSDTAGSLSGDEWFSYRSTNPVDYYYKIWVDDLPVFVTSDSVLDAWHQTFLGMLEETEEIYLYPKLRSMLTDPDFGQLTEEFQEWDSAGTAGASHVKQAIRDVDLYLGVASRLCRGGVSSYDLVDGFNVDLWHQDAIQHVKTRALGLYGDGDRIENMTLYQVRGHYANSRALGSYFQSLLWLSRMQFHIASPLDLDQERRELRAATYLALHVREKDQLDDWEAIEGMMQLFAGQSDAMTIKEMLALLDAQGITISDIASDIKMAQLRSAILATTYGVQEINGGQHEAAGESCEHLTADLPRALSLFGQRWTPDAWTFNQVVVPNVRDDIGETLHRRKPSGLDAMFAVLGNDSAAPILADRMEDENGVWLRDGIPFQNELCAVRRVIDGQAPEFWTEHLYGSWLHSLRSLSPGISSGPETFRTSAWKNRMMNTQLASWTHLRHDTLLYAEQSFTPPLLCEFPDGYVDPYPEFWQRMSEMALRWKSVMETVEFSGDFRVEKRNSDLWGGGEAITAANLSDHWSPEIGYFYTPGGLGIPDHLLTSVPLDTRAQDICDHLENFSTQCLTLKEIAEGQLAGTPRSTEQTEFLKSVVESVWTIYGGDRQYTGWFGALYYVSLLQKSGEDSDRKHPSAEWNPVVVDVHTDSIDLLCTGDPGGVLHEGVGYTQFMLVAVKHPDGSTCTFGGPVFNHHEFWTEDPGTRWDNAKWEQELGSGNAPAQADWKKSFRVPISTDPTE